MKVVRRSLCIGIGIIGSLYACEPPTTTFLPIHSQSFNVMRTLAGNDLHMALPNANRPYATFSATPEYVKTFRPERIVQCLFGTDIIKCQNTITVSGSTQENRRGTDWLADYFGLPTDYLSCLTFAPHVEEILLDGTFYFGYKKIYGMVQAPLVRTKWHLDYCEDILQSGTTDSAAGSLSETAVPRNNLVQSATNYLTGCNAPSIEGIIYEPLKAARMSSSAQELTSFADVNLYLGYLFAATPNYHVGSHVRWIIPTGNRPLGTYLFEPIVGNGRQHELGIGFNAHWQSENPDNAYETVRFDVALEMTHPFATEQRRSFDLCHKPNSRYMLAQKMAPVTDGLTGPVGSDTIEAQFANHYAPVANLTTLNVTVKNSIQVDGALLFSYVKEDAGWTFGYGIWAKSKDKLCLKEQPTEINNWALKGDAYVFGFPTDSAAPIALSATESDATINAGTNKTSTTNEGIDNPVNAYKNNTIPLANTPGGTDQLATSLQPIRLTPEDVDLNSAATRGFANKIMFLYNKTLSRSEELNGSISLGAEIEFGNRHYTACANPEKILNSALSHWGVWVKGSVTFK